MENHNPDTLKQQPKETNVAAKTTKWPLLTKSNDSTESSAVLVAGIPLKEWTMKEFMTRFNPDMQNTVVGEDIGKLCCMPCVTLAHLSTMFTPAGALFWIKAQLIRFNDFVGVSIKLSAIQLEELSKLILSTYSMLNLLEFCAFMVRLKSGEYERFYSAVDPMRILASLKIYMKDRCEARHRYHEREEALRRERDARSPEYYARVYKEYVEMKLKNGETPGVLPGKTQCKPSSGQN